MRPDADALALDLAAGQHGLVNRRQLLAAGVADHVVDRRVQAGRLRPIHRGVYLVGPVAPPHATEMAAVLACGPGAFVSHGSAAALTGLLPMRPKAVHVIVRKGRPRRRGVRAHRIATLRDDEVTTFDRIPVTTPARTLYDLASVARGRTVERAVAEAVARRLTDVSGIRRLLGRHAGRRGTGRLRAILDGGRPALTRSEAEERFLALVRRARLAEPVANIQVAGHEVDFFWRGQRLVAEIDGFAFHSSPAAFEEDRSRDADLVAVGLRVVRVTWRQLVREPEALVARVAAALASGVPEPGRGSAGTGIVRSRG